MNSHAVYTILDLIGTFVFAISGAVAARQRRLDLFGIVVIAFMVACGGGIVRDVCIGAIPPAGLSNWRYLATALAASAVTILAYPQVRRLRQPVLFFDAIGLGLFAVSGAQKALTYGHNAELAILLGVVSAVGGGVMRDVVLSRVPAILEREIYASAALFGAAVQVGFAYAGWTDWWTPWFATLACVLVRLASLRYGWRLPVFQGRRAAETRDNS
ncbi:putative membrane protein YeiH [Paraburkholderia atlantica]|uniref:Putative membrane protein YeiH n=2 Tax=Paraburkholderia atlantica TaxID=2654982 RepID=A0A6I1PUT1_PARAM|nr:trimeric intracellular cation channel family protein [Paraburkholderia atlantica]MBB5418623.1 putative membrane protein YeiH [Paraburkholderia atlantica]MBB5423259.1 putative membrane protein YeiH [Paraburkholderia atlantica]MPW08756.1 trimeric intracellular cation channel family protein [Paraburkholderia atlantica]NUY30035.1 trimeric intracellular cation channel family protein [Paraburkholderia atlantica]